MEETNQKFGFGIEAEFLVCDKTTFAPLSHLDLDFGQLLNIVENIPVSDVSMVGFNAKPLHKKITPYLIEGYYLTDSEMQPTTLLPKGIEIRTPLVESIEQATSDLDLLYTRLTAAMEKAGYGCSIISHHPNATPLQAPPNYKRHDYWQWALTATTTFGPDINIRLPEELGLKINLAELNSKVNYYMPAAAALSFASPLSEGGLWTIKGKTGKSIRTYRRSLWAPMHYVHEKPSLRFEFKGFEMSQDLRDYEAYFLMGLAILLDDSLEGKASDQTRIYDLGALAVSGLDTDEMRERAACVLESAQRTASHLGLDCSCLRSFWSRLDTNTVPADRIIQIFKEENSIPETLRRLSKINRPTRANQNNIAVAQPMALCGMR